MSRVASVGAKATAAQDASRRKKYWSKSEIASLLSAARTYGVDDWATIATEPRFSLTQFSAQDLAKKYERLQAESQGDGHDGNLSETKHTEVQRDTKLCQRRERRAFSAKEDEMLLEGFAAHGPRWSKILRDNKADFCHRRSTDLRDRFRNAFPDRYAKAGFKSRAAKPKNRRRHSTDPSDAGSDGTDDRACDGSVQRLPASLAMMSPPPQPKPFVIETHRSLTLQHHSPDLADPGAYPCLYSELFDYQNTGMTPVTPILPITPRSMSIVESETSMSSISPISTYSVEYPNGLFVSGALLEYPPPPPAAMQYPAEIPTDLGRFEPPALAPAFHSEEVDDWLGNAIDFMNHETGDLF